MTDIEVPEERDLQWLFYRRPVKLIDCPPGLFLFDGCLGFKSEYYQSDKVSMDVFVVESGEAFWGGTSKHDERAELLVMPVTMEKFK